MLRCDTVKSSILQVMGKLCECQTTILLVVQSLPTKPRVFIPAGSHHLVSSWEYRRGGVLFVILSVLTPCKTIDLPCKACKL
jgi:hypothetical protein